MAKQFTSGEWKLIRARLEDDPERFGLPQREYGSVLQGSFIIRKLGSSRSRNPDTWEFLADVCRSFDLLAVQEIMDGPHRPAAVDVPAGAGVRPGGFRPDRRVPG